MVAKNYCPHSEFMVAKNCMLPFTTWVVATNYDPLKTILRILSILLWLYNTFTEYFRLVYTPSRDCWTWKICPCLEAISDPILFAKCPLLRKLGGFYKTSQPALWSRKLISFLLQPLYFSPGNTFPKLCFHWFLQALRKKQVKNFKSIHCMFTKRLFSRVQLFQF